MHSFSHQRMDAPSRRAHPISERNPMQVYLDNSATTRVCPEAAQAAMDMMTQVYGNPSSLYPLGMEAEKRLRLARNQVANAFGCEETEVCFTSGGTESDNMAIFGTAQARRHQGRELITSAVEHPAVLECFRQLGQQGWKVTYIGVDDKCRLDLEALRAAITEETVLLSFMTVNNETGAIFPIEEISRMKGQATLHTDGVQALGKEDLTHLGADLISVSGHKIFAPKGVGALYIRKGIKLPPLLQGGGQEKGLRSGTENTPGIVALGKAVELAVSQRTQRMAQVQQARDRLLEGIQSQISDVVINSPQEGCPAVLSVSFLGTRGEVLLHTLEQDQIYVSTGSACSSGKKGGSHVLRAMGLSEEAIAGTVRFSFSPWHTPEEMDYVTDRLAAAVARMRNLRRKSR